jgi:hypothetical protein
MSQIDWTALGTLGTWLLALIAFASFWVQFYFTRQQLTEARKGFTDSLAVQREVSRNEVGTRLYLTMTARFDRPRMDKARKRLAEHFLDEEPDEELDEYVLSFYEDLGSLLREGHLNEELAYHAFSYPAERWWILCSGYVSRLRTRKGDRYLFSEFEFFANRMFEMDVTKLKIPRTDLEKLEPTEREEFLKSEAELL